MDGHQLHAAIAASLRGRLGGELIERRIKAGAEQVLLAVRELVEATPEQIEVRAGGRVYASRAADKQPDPFQPGSQRRGWLGCAKCARRSECFDHAGGGCAPGFAEDRKPFCH